MLTETSRRTIEPAALWARPCQLRPAIHAITGLDTIVTSAIGTRASKRGSTVAAEAGPGTMGVVAVRACGHEV